MEKENNPKYPFSVKDLVKNKQVSFSKYRQGNFYYTIKVYFGEEENEFDEYQFPVPDDDIGDGTLERDEKAIYFMRWISRAMKDDTLIKI